MVCLSLSLVPLHPALWTPVIISAGKILNYRWSRSTAQININVINECLNVFYKKILLLLYIQYTLETFQTRASYNIRYDFIPWCRIKIHPIVYLYIGLWVVNSFKRVELGRIASSACNRVLKRKKNELRKNLIQCSVCIV